ncbi:MAG: carbonic anhydrase family protein [Spirochaetaceae bacterium]|jgi:carbonic anhydrase|nr:carbonic anhydrase family protein [Spirochaetaceae bacterium]
MIHIFRGGRTCKTGLFSVLARLAVFSIATLVFSACATARTPDAEAPHWSYEGETGPDNWYLLDPAYAIARDGKAQSPVDIVTADLTADPGIGKPLISYSETSFEVENNGHTIELTPVTDGNTISIDGEIYALRQFHFHAPSEHSVDGKFFDMELHLVHGNEGGGLAVLALMIAEGPVNETLAALFDNLPGEVGGEETEVKINLADIFTGAGTAYRYDGSLTTPPCSEGVKWTVYMPPITLSRAQIDAYLSIYNGNKRPVQNRYGRPIYKAE